MEHFGILSIIPPLLTIILAILTKDVIVSLFLGIFSGTLIVAGGNPFQAMLMLADKIADTLADGWSIRIVLFTILLGMMVGLLSKTGSAYALGDWASKKIKTKTGALLFTWVFGLLIFFDDYFNSLTIGTCMRPLTDAKRISRAKLAYILDSTAAPVAILAPLSTWVVYVMGQFSGAEFESLGVTPMQLFLRSIPFNLYAIFAVFMVLFITITYKDFGPMARSAARAEKGIGLYDSKKYGIIAAQVESKAHDSGKAKAFDFVVPILAFVVIALTFFPLQFWMSQVGSGEGQVATLGAAIAATPFAEAFNNSDSSKALMYASIISLAFAYVYYLIRGLIKMTTGGEALLDGFKAMTPAVTILTLAWGIGSIIKSAPADGGVGMAAYVSDFVVNGNFPLYFVPIVVFIISCLISFAAGTSWGTMGIMVPITMPVMITLAKNAGMDPNAVINATALAIGAVLGGSVFGDHCSPISDTTILSSTGAACPHLEHVATQLPYAAFVALCAGIGIVAASLAGFNAIVGLAVTAVVFVAGTLLLPRWLGEAHYKLED
ncbi:MAG: Na+/H+ antiporter NhaC family protein [Spirochaetes bacterium]|nr:Na+/H+ antiporter NhaC family protein [Spirochaetota bacterium]MBU1079781.1 Na+/H+ antiporter NhaC family protein [Spirochaetota bacterium]